MLGSEFEKLLVDVGNIGLGLTVQTLVPLFR